MHRETAPFIQRLVQSKLALLLEVILLVGLCAAVGREMIIRHQTQSQIDQLESQAKALEQKNRELSQVITLFNSPSYQEEQARLQLNLQKPGESVVTVLGAQTSTTNSQSTPEAATTSQTRTSSSNPQRWLRFFLKDSTI